MPKKDPVYDASTNAVITLTDYAEKDKATEAARILCVHEQIKRALFLLVPNFNRAGVVAVDSTFEICQVSIDSETITFADVDATFTCP